MAASDYIITSSAAMCPYGVLASDAGYSASTFLLSSITNVRPGDVTVGMAAMVDDEIVKVTAVTYPTIAVERGCADTVPAIHRVGAPVWFFSSAMGTDNRAYTATDTVAVKLLPYTTGGANIPIEESPPNNITFNWRHFRPYPPAQVKCKGTDWYLGYKEMALGTDTLTWTWVHRDRILQADQLIGHTAASVGPEPGTTYKVEVYSHDGALLRTVNGIVGSTWTYTRAMVEVDGHTLPEAFIDLYSVRDGLTSLQKYRTRVWLEGGNLTAFNYSTLGWPGTQANCGLDGLGGLMNAGTLTWDDVDVEWQATEETWGNTPTSPIAFESVVHDLGVSGEYKFNVNSVAQGTLVAQISTSSDGVNFSAWTVPPPDYIVCRYVRSRFTVSGPDPSLLSAKLGYFRRS